MQYLLVHALFKVRSCPGAFILRVWSDQTRVAVPVRIAEVDGLPIQRRGILNK